MAWFDPRAYGRAPSSRRAKLFVLGASSTILVGLSVLVTGVFAQSSGVVAQAKKRGFVPVCVQRHDVKFSKGDLNVLVGSQCAKGQKPLKLALWPVKRKPGPAGKQGAQGPAGPQGAQGAQGPAGPQGAAGAPATTPEYAVVRVFVQRGNGPRSAFATYSAPLGSPAGTTTGGDFRFTCNADEDPCKISYGAAVISDRSGDAAVYPRLLIHKESGAIPNNGPPDAAIVFSKYVDGDGSGAGLAQVLRVPLMRISRARRRRVSTWAPGRSTTTAPRRLRARTGSWTRSKCKRERDGSCLLRRRGTFTFVVQPRSTPHAAGMVRGAILPAFPLAVGLHAHPASRY